MVSTPHCEPHRGVGMRLPFLHVPVSHEVIAKENMGLDSLQRVVSVLGRDRDRGEGSGEEDRLLRG